MIHEGTAFASHDRVANQISPITFQNVRQSDRPLQDEWGIFDPQQAGLEALLRKVRSRISDGDTTHVPPAPAKK